MFATAGRGFSVGFWSITAFRMLVGVGESTFVSLAAPFVLNVAPSSQVGGALGWRASFGIESLLMPPFAAFGFMSDRIYLKGELDKVDVNPPSDEESLHRQRDNANIKQTAPSQGGLLSDMKELTMSKVYTTNVLGIRSHCL